MEQELYMLGALVIGKIAGVALHRWFPQVIPFLFNFKKGLAHSEDTVDELLSMIDNLKAPNASYRDLAKAGGLGKAASVIQDRLLEP